MQPFGPLFDSLIRRRFGNPTRFAEAVGLSEPYVSRIIRGERKPPLDHVDAWSKALLLTPEQTAELTLSAQIAHSHPEVGARILSLEQHISRQETIIADLKRQVEILKDVVRQPRREPTPRPAT